MGTADSEPLDVVDVTNDTMVDDQSDNGGPIEDESEPYQPPPLSLQERLGFGDDKEGWMDFRVIPFFQAVSDCIKFIVKRIMKKEGVDFTKCYEDQHLVVLGNVIAKVHFPRSVV